MNILIQSNVQMGFGTVLSNIYECIHISQKLKNHHRTLYVNCLYTNYFNSDFFLKIFNIDYLLNEFDNVIVSDNPYNGELFYRYTLGHNKPGLYNWDVFTSESDGDIRKVYDHKLGQPNKFSFNSNDVRINGTYNIFSDYVHNQYQKKYEPYVSISFRGKNMTDVKYPIDKYNNSFIEIVKNNFTYVCGTSQILKNKLSEYKNVFFNNMYINEEDFSNMYDDEKLKQLTLLCLDILYLNDCNHIYHYTYFNQISFFLFIPYINGVPITKIPIGYDG
jgi:hypothetical protein